MPDVTSPLNALTVAVAAAPDSTSADLGCSGSGVVTIDLSGAYTGLSAQIEVSMDGQSWRSADSFMCWEQTQNASYSGVNGISSARKFIVSTYGVRRVRLNVTALATGSVTVTMTAQAGIPPLLFPFNQNISVLASASRAASNQSADQSNYFNRGIVLAINVTNAGTGSITVTLEGKDPVSGNYYPILASAAIVANGLTMLQVYPGLTAAANAFANAPLPRTWRVNVTHNNANPITYSVGASALV